MNRAAPATGRRPIMSDGIDATLRRNILVVLRDLDPEEIRPGRNLEDLDANSLERIEILSRTLEDLGLEVDPLELRETADLGELSALLGERKERT
jgi:polyketide biosynthesis acyl carrier protein